MIVSPLRSMSCERTIECAILSLDIYSAKLAKDIASKVTTRPQILGIFRSLALSHYVPSMFFYIYFFTVMDFFSCLLSLHDFLVHSNLWLCWLHWWLDSELLLWKWSTTSTNVSPFRVFFLSFSASIHSAVLPFIKCNIRMLVIWVVSTVYS